VKMKKNFLILLSMLVMAMFIVGCGSEVDEEVDPDDMEFPEGFDEEEGEAMAGQATKIRSTTYVSCEDSDGGSNIYVPGYITVLKEKYGVQKVFSKTDYYNGRKNKFYERRCSGDLPSVDYSKVSNHGCNEFVSVPLKLQYGDIKNPMTKNYVAWACKCSSDSQCGSDYKCNAEGVCVAKVNTAECTAALQKCEKDCGEDLYDCEEEGENNCDDLWSSCKSDCAADEVECVEQIPIELGDCTENTIIKHKGNFITADGNVFGYKGADEVDDLYGKNILFKDFQTGDTHTRPLSFNDNSWEVIFNLKHGGITYNFVNASNALVGDFDIKHVCAECVPKECIYQDYAGGIKECGIIDDGCGGTVNCNYQQYEGGLECPSDYSCEANNCVAVEKPGCEQGQATGEITCGTKGPKTYATLTYYNQNCSTYEQDKFCGYGSQPHNCLDGFGCCKHKEYKYSCEGDNYIFTNIYDCPGVNTTFVTDCSSKISPISGEPLVCEIVNNEAGCQDPCNPGDTSIECYANYNTYNYNTTICNENGFGYQYYPGEGCPDGYLCEGGDCSLIE